MKKQLTAFLVYLLEKLGHDEEFYLKQLKQCGYKELIVPQSIEEWVRAATPLVLYWESANPDLSGELRRHRVYARLIKHFPTAKRLYLSIAIDTALARVRGL